jgi:hypothetical protein
VPRALAAIGAALVTLALAVVAIKLAPDSQTANSSEV